MEPVVLVAYATKGGSTAELANVLAEVLREDGMAAEVRQAREVQELEPYSAVVLAAALYMGRLHRDARRFLEKHRAQLEKMPVALIVPGPVQDVEKDWAGAREQLDKEQARYPWLSPVARHIVGGVFDPARLGFPYTLIPALRRMKPMDARDWAAIRGMARAMALNLEGEISAKA